MPGEATLAIGTLHLTQILVPYELAIKQLKIRDRYDWHQHIWKGFAEILPPRPDKGRFAQSTRPEEQARTPPDFLSRIDEVEAGYRLLVVSVARPRQPDWCPANCFGAKHFPEDFFAHPRYRFSLLANPTKMRRVFNPDGTRRKNGRRVPLTQREDLIAWLKRKGAAGGFDIETDSLRTIHRGGEFFHRPGSGRGTHSVVEFLGLLTNQDPEQLRNTVATGIGSAKAFGFGLLVLEPIP